MSRARLVVTLALLAVGPARAQEARQKKEPPAPGWRAEPFAVENRSAGVRLALSGYVQADGRSFRDWPPTGQPPPAEELEWRRIRLGVEGQWRRLSFEVQADPHEEGDELKDAWVALRIARALRVRGGHMKLPVSAEFLTSAAKTDFVERAAFVDALAPGRDWGVVVYGEAGHALDYQLGAFKGDGSRSDGRAGTTAASRLVLRPARWLALGGSFSRGEVVAAPAGPDFDPSPKGFSGRGVTQYRFFAPLFVDGRRLRWGTDARVEAGPVSLWGEYLQAREERRGQGPTFEDLPEARGSGWSTTLTWLVTGEKKTRTVKPLRSLFGGPGAIELAARYQDLRMDDVRDEGFETVGSRAGNVRPGRYRAFSSGVSWWPGPFLRLMGNAVVERYGDALRAPLPGKEGSYVSLLGRVQVQLP